MSVAGALAGLGFTPEIMQVALDLGSIENLPSRRPLLVFNLVDTINCDGRFAPLVPARLDALGIAYTGCRTNALFETLSKVGTKLRLAHADLPTPEWSTDGTGFKRDTRVIVKASWEHGSLGIDEMSVTRGADAQRTIAARTWRLKTEHFAEAYIEGREFHLALLERISGVEVLPIAEIVFGGFKAQAPKIFGYDAKWTPGSQQFVGTPRRFGVDVGTGASYSLTASDVGARLRVAVTATNGGGSMWESPIIDPKLNLAIFGTGNPVPWNSRGPGANLWTSSIVAFDANSSK